MSGTNQEVLLDDELIENDLNDAIADLQKSLESDSTENLQKATDGDEKPAKKPTKKDDEEEEESEEEEEMEYEKSISEILAEDPDASAAIDVEPFLRQLSKAIDETIDNLYSAVNQRLGKVEQMVKSQSAVLLQTAKLEKSTADMVAKIGGQTVPSGSMKVLSKSRFEADNKEGVEFDNLTVLAKSRDWVQKKLINLNDAGKIELRINKGILGKVNDGLDARVRDLMGQEDK